VRYKCIFTYTTVTEREDRIYSMLYIKRKYQHLKNENSIITISDVSAEKNKNKNYNIKISEYYKLYVIYIPCTRHIFDTT